MCISANGRIMRAVISVGITNIKKKNYTIYCTCEYFHNLAMCGHLELESMFKLILKMYTFSSSLSRSCQC